jgi:solute carrier family 25 protein 39/40
VVAGIIVSPIELMRTKLQAWKGYSYGEMFSAVRQSIKIDGIRPLYRGLPPSLLRDVPYSAFLWMSYETLKPKLNEAFNTNSTFIVPFITAEITGAAAGIATQPFDVIKTHHQMTVGELEEAGADKFPSMLATSKKIWNHYGWRGLFAGITARTVKVGTAFAMMISSYEHFKAYFRRQNIHRISGKQLQVY